MKILSFLYYYLKSMRLYYGFVTLSAGWVGIVLYPGIVSRGSYVLLSVILFSCWGVNQIINDYFNLEEDKINAPGRPMACGKLNVRGAMTISVGCIIGILVYSMWKNPIACVPIAAGVLANIYYSKTKNILLFAFSISCCAWFAYGVLGGRVDAFFTANHGQNAILFLGLLGCNALMTFFTYFKDVQGDKSVGKRTPQVIFGNEPMRKAGLVLGLLPLGVAVLVYLCTGWHVALGVWLAGSILSALTGFLFYRPHSIQNDYFYLKYNFAACCALQAGLVAWVNPLAGSWLALGCALGVLSIFSGGYTHADE